MKLFSSRTGGSSAELQLDGPWQLTEKNIEKVAKLAAPGAFVLGVVKGGQFLVSYVGRDDEDVQAAIFDAYDRHGRATHFKMSYLATAHAAWQKHCHLWHGYGGAEGKLYNRDHPEPPAGSRIECPVCGYPMKKR
ncbi:MAG: hypothetical protein AAF220_10495 [Pseudomonadota bacterium]